MNDTKIKKTIMKKVKDKEIRIKPKWWWRVGDGLVRGSWAVGILVLMWVGVGLRWWWEFFDPREWWQYGQFGRQVVWDEAPKWWLLGLLVGITILGRWYRRLGENYRKNNFGAWIMIGLVVAAGTILWWVGRNWWELTVLLRFI